MIKFNLADELAGLKKGFYNNKRYWLIYLALILLISFSLMKMKNYSHPEMEIIVIVLLSIFGILCISYCNVKDEENLFKTAFIVILIFGLLCCFLTPICFVPDEVEHFVRTEMTSRGELIPDYENNSFLTIQTTLDLIEKSKISEDTGFDGINFTKATVFKTKADENPINYTLVKYPSAFAQNPFYGYLMPAIGMLIAKILDLNSIWLLWLGRIFNTILYASLVSLAVKKSPILKVPLIVAACIPLAIFQIASLSIDSLINGLGILMISYFFYMYKSPKNDITRRDVLIFSALGLLLGLCKVTYFAFIFLILAVPKENFKEKKYYYYGIASIGLLAIIAVIWTKFYANAAYMESFRHLAYIKYNVNPSEQIDYVLAHKKDAIISILQYPKYIDSNLLFNTLNLYFNKYNSLYLLFLGGVILLYPMEKFQLKSRVVALFTCIFVYFGTYFSFLLTWTPVGVLKVWGMQPRYFLPLFGLLPFIFGFNNFDGDKSTIDNCLMMITIAFMSLMVISLVVSAY